MSCSRTTASPTSRRGTSQPNGAWLACAVLAHNLTRWAVTLGDTKHRNQLIVARTIRTQLIAVPARAHQQVRRPGPALAHPLAMG